VELAFSLPASFKIKEGQQKWMIRGVAKNLLPGKITLAPKRPLQTPQREWLAGELVSWADEKVKTASALPFFKSNAVLSAWDEYKKGDMEQSFYIWQWISAAEFLADSQ
jgi:asparagine synthase (glutamine-hydrolysing)